MNTSLKQLFKRYMIEKDPDKAHATLSASGAERWMNCPQSVRLSQGIKTVDSEYSIAGTHAHTLLQFILENENWQDLLSVKEANAFKKHITFSDDQLRSVMVAVKYIEGLKRKYPKAEVHAEKKVELKGVGFGTSDVIMFQMFGILHVMDYKNGQSAVEAKENLQMLYYSHAAADLFGWDFHEAWMTIIQPNANHREGPIRTWMTTSERLEDAGHEFRKGAHRTTKKDASLVPGKWCWFCPAKNKCPVQMKDRETKILSRFQ
jgi:hypothetical protein